MKSQNASSRQGCEFREENFLVLADFFLLLAKNLANMRKVASGFDENESFVHLEILILICRALGHMGC